MNKLDKIKEIVLNNLGGFSVDFNTLKPIVADKDLYCIAITDNSKKDITKSIKSVLSASLLFNQINNLVLGGWYDESSNRYCLDLVLTEENRDNALFMAKKFNQKAIFNLKTFEEIKNEDYK
jgi:hypothetical protein